MSGYSADELARRAGVSADFVSRLAELTLLEPVEAGAFTELDARRAVCFEALARAGVPLEALAVAVDAGAVSLDFLEDPVYEKFAATGDETFASVAERTSVPIDLLSVIREALGSPPPVPDDHVRTYELTVASYLEAAIRIGFSPQALERQLRIMGESLRRIAETEGDMWYTELIAPRAAKGLTGAEIVNADAYELSGRSDAALQAVLHGQQAQVWMSNIVRAVGGQLAQAGLHSRSERLPAICFLDVTGFTRLTQEHGDAASAQLAEQLGRIVTRTSAEHHGKPVKWLGDGVMFYFADPADAVVAALEMVGALRDAGLPPAHVGVECGEVVFQQGDYFGQTVNVAARIADFARPGEVLVSQAVLDATSIPDVAFAEIGPVELKGVAGPMRLHAASRTA